MSASLSSYEAWLVLCAYIAECPHCGGFEKRRGSRLTAPGRKVGRTPEERERRFRRGISNRRWAWKACGRCKWAARLAEQLRPGVARPGPLLMANGLTRRKAGVVA